MKIFLFILILLESCARETGGQPVKKALRHEQLYLVNADSLYGYIDSLGNVIFPIGFKNANSFNEGHAIAQRGDSSFVLGTDGSMKFIAGPLFSFSTFKDGVCTLNENYGEAVISDTNGKIILEPEKRLFSTFSEGFALAAPGSKQFGGSYRFIDLNGQVLDMPAYYYPLEFSEGRAGVCDSLHNCGFINSAGKMVIPISYKFISSFSEGLAAVAKEDGDIGFINKNGSWVISPAFKGFASFKEGIAAVSDGKAWWFIDHTGKKVADIPGATEVRHMSYGLAVGITESGMGYLDRTGKFVIPPVYNSVQPFDHALGGVTDSTGKWMYVNRRGEVVWPRP